MVQVFQSVPGERLRPAPTLQVRAHTPDGRFVGGERDEVAFEALFSDGYGMEAVLALGSGAVAPGLVARTLREARQSDLFTGTDPDHWSPLAGRPDFAALGRLEADVELSMALMDRPLDAGEPARAVRVDQETNNGWLTFHVRDGDDWTADVALSPDAFITVVPPEMNTVVVAPEPRDVTREPDGFGPAIASDVEWGVIWRSYVGEGTEVVDGVLRAPRERGFFGRITLPARRGAAILVGRVVMLASRGALRERDDPTRRQRLAEYMAADRETTHECPDVSYAGRHESPVVAVHGTMGCAIPIAATMRDLLPKMSSVLRFEHDTWDSVTNNAQDLTNSLLGRVQARNVTLVAHSRGGLVARHAAHLLRGHDVYARVVSLGTPYRGTPLIGTAEASRLGARAMLGALRWLGGPLIDTTTRLAGLALPRCLPSGIAVMQENSDYLLLAESTLGSIGITAVGGSTHDGSESWSFVDEALGQVFTQEPNDRVVAQSSALAVGVARPIVSDHFSYLLDPDVRELLRQSHPTTIIG